MKFIWFQVNSLQFSTHSYNHSFSKLPPRRVPGTTWYTLHTIVQILKHLSHPHVGDHPDMAWKNCLVYLREIQSWNSDINVFSRRIHEHISGYFSGLIQKWPSVLIFSHWCSEKPWLSQCFPIRRSDDRTDIAASRQPWDFTLAAVEKFMVLQCHLQLASPYGHVIHRYR